MLTHLVELYMSIIMRIERDDLVASVTYRVTHNGRGNI